MANPLTGDFEAVLQVSGGTLNRLLASMHQNGGANPATPTLPHVARLRIGDPHPIDGMRGTVAAQIGVPRIELIHGSSDHFWLEVDVRARYTADPGTTPLAEIIHGTIRAQYRLDSIDPGCRGWRALAADHVWVRVVGDSVSFKGEAYDQADPWSVVVNADPTTALARVTRVATVLLRTRFEATPHRVSRRFQRGAMRSLHVAGGRTVVALPLGLDGDPTPGRIDSLNQDLLEGHDFGVGISAAAILARVQPALDDFRAGFSLVYGFSYTFNVDVGLFDVDVVKVNISWRITLATAQAQWSGGVFPLIGLSTGVLTITLTGQARTEKGQYNWDFTVTILVLVSFDTASERFIFTTVGSPTVHFSGPFGGIVEAYARPEIEKAISAQITPLVNGFAGGLDLGPRKTELVRQLQTIDDRANAAFTEAVYSPDGVIVRGRILLSPRRAPVHHFEREGDDAFSALESWVPGGRIDTHRWSWEWFNGGGSPGSIAGTDTFLLRRPRATSLGKFGIAAGLRQPLPGLDGSGRVCLDVAGVQVDPVTGAWTPASTGRRCTRFGFDFTLTVSHVDPVFVQEWVPGPRDPIGPVEEVGIVQVGQGDAATGVNTLIVHAGDRWTRETGAILREGLAAVRRRDAGMRVIVLFDDGALRGADAAFLPEIQELGQRLEAPLLLQEDVRGSWGRALGLRRGETEWRLVSPTGGLVWAETGRLEPRALGEALDDHLFPAPPPTVRPIVPPLRPGVRLSAAAIDVSLLGVFDDIESPCPPPPFSRLGVEAVVAFVQHGSTASEALIRTLVDDQRQADRDTVFAVVVGGLRADALDEIQAQWPPEVLIVPDPAGAIARQAGVRVWPTRIGISEAGIVTRVDVGAADGDTRRDRESGS